MLSLFFEVILAIKVILTQKPIKMKKAKASYETVATYKKVLVIVPGMNDKYMKFVEAHEFQVLDGSTAKVPEHFRRGDVFGDNFLARHFFITPEMRGKKIIATVEVVAKMDYVKDKLSLILNITPENGPEYDFRLKIGTPNGDFSIPGDSKKFVKFEKTQ